MVSASLFKHDRNLEHLTDLLHLFHHRNQNQHRRSIWWRSFSIFRRQLNAHVKDIKLLNETPATHLERSRKVRKDKQIQCRVSLRICLWQHNLVPKWQHAFSQVIADGRFAPLGLMLQAALAQTCQIVGITSSFEDLAQAEIEKVLNQFGEEAWGPEGDAGRTMDELGEDLGEVISRDAVPVHAGLDLLKSRRTNALRESDTEPTKHPGRTGSPDLTPPSPRSRSRHKGGNAIDALFSRLD